MILRRDGFVGFWICLGTQIGDATLVSGYALAVPELIAWFLACQGQCSYLMQYAAQFHPSSNNKILKI